MASSVTIFPIDPAAEARRLAGLFDDLSNALDNFRGKLPPETSPEHLAALKARAQELEDQSHVFTAEAIGATLLAIREDLTRIKEATEQAKSQLETLDNVAKVISIATSVLNLGTAIATGNPDSILSATDALAQNVAGDAV